MHNGVNGASLLLHTSVLLPTHLVVVNLDERLQDPIEEMAAFLPSFGVTILHVHAAEGATVRLEDINEAQMIRMLPDLASFDLEDPYPWASAAYRFHRPSILNALRGAFKAWADEHGERTVILFVGAPRTPLDAALLGELPLDAQALFFRRTGSLPLVLRFMVAPRRPFTTDDDLPLAHLLSRLEQTYFELPDFPLPFEGHTNLDSPSGSMYDTAVWVDGEEGTEVVHFLRAVLRQHGDENARFENNAPPRQVEDGPGPAPLDLAMRAEAEHRLVDWLALCAAQFAPRLWTQGLPALGAVLDMEHDKRRRKDPFAAIGRYERERNWDANLLVQTYLSQLDTPRTPFEDLAKADFPYRLTDEDRPSKLEMARHLSDLGEFERAAMLAIELLEDDPHHRLLNRMVGTDLWVAGYRDRGREVLRHCIALTEIDPRLDEAERADEIATLYHLMNDYDQAISGYERAIEADPRNVHAYQGLVMIHRGRGEVALADHWLQSALRRDLELPLVESEDRLEEAFERARPADFAASEPDETRARERRSRWWSFLKR